MKKRIATILIAVLTIADFTKSKTIFLTCYQLSLPKKAKLGEIHLIHGKKKYIICIFGTEIYSIFLVEFFHRWGHYRGVSLSLTMVLLFYHFVGKLHTGSSAFNGDWFDSGI